MTRIPCWLGIAMLIGCSPFPRDFRAAAATDPPRSALGAWRGEWSSETNGHHGPLWCIVSPTPGQPGHTDFRYRAGWGLLQFGDYVHTVAATPAADGTLALDDEMELPGGFGRYRVVGRVDPETFDVRYHSRGDRGTMSLRRP